MLLALESYMYGTHVSTFEVLVIQATALAKFVMHKIYISAICSTRILFTHRLSVLKSSNEQHFQSEKEERK
jgi:sorbitol-specific phosphotransferase system component IIBC